MFAFFCDDDEVKKLMGDSTVVHAHACAAGAPAPSQALPVNQALGRSRGGFTTKIHVLVNGCGNPLRAILTPGQAADAPQVPLLFDQFSPSIAILDKAYDTMPYWNFSRAKARSRLFPLKPIVLYSGSMTMIFTKSGTWLNVSLAKLNNFAVFFRVSTNMPALTCTLSTSPVH
jgi:hypothetical protein